MENEQNKPIHDVECISCKNFFTCKHGKEKFGRPCIRFEERGNSTWQVMSSGSK